MPEAAPEAVEPEPAVDTAGTETTAGEAAEDEAAVSTTES